MIHGLFIVHHQAQLISLVGFDFLQIYVAIKFYSYFASKTILILSMLYKITILFFDISLYLFCYHNELDWPFEFITMILIFIAIGFVILKTLFIIGEIIYKCIKKIKFYIQNRPNNRRKTSKI